MSAILNKFQESVGKPKDAKPLGSGGNQPHSKTLRGVTGSGNEKLEKLAIKWLQISTEFEMKMNDIRKRLQNTTKKLLNIYRTNMEKQFNEMNKICYNLSEHNVNDD